MKRYKLLKDLPGCKKGAIFEKGQAGYKCQTAPYSWIGMPKEVVEDTPDWFEEIVENKVRKSRL